MIARLTRRWGPVLLWAIGIFYFSSLPQPLGSLSGSQRGGLMGRGAHCAEYAGLAAWLYRAVVGDHGRRRAFLTSFAAALVYALSDELHQELVPGRSFELVDVAYDVAGMILAFGFIWMFGEERYPIEYGQDL
jgi:hypothetical protein